VRVDYEYTNSGGKGFEQITRFECLVCMPAGYEPVGNILRPDSFPWSAGTLELWDDDHWVNSPYSLAGLVEHVTMAQQHVTVHGDTHSPPGSPDWVRNFFFAQLAQNREAAFPPAGTTCPHLWRSHGHEPSTSRSDLRHLAVWQNLAAVLDQAGALQKSRYLMAWPDETATRYDGRPFARAVHLYPFFSGDRPTREVTVALSQPVVWFDLLTGEPASPYPLRTPEQEAHAREMYRTWEHSTSDPVRDAVLHAATRELFRATDSPAILAADTWVRAVLLTDTRARAAALNLLASRQLESALQVISSATNTDTSIAAPWPDAPSDKVLPGSDWLYWSPGAHWFAPPFWR
jgi:hypothetical protein